METTRNISLIIVPLPQQQRLTCVRCALYVRECSRKVCCSYNTRLHFRISFWCKYFCIGKCGQIVDAIIQAGFDISALKLVHVEVAAMDEFLAIYKDVVRQYHVCTYCGYMCNNKVTPLTLLLLGTHQVYDICTMFSNRDSRKWCCKPIPRFLRSIWRTGSPSIAAQIPPSKIW